MNRRQQLVSRPLVALAIVMAMTAGVASAQTNVKPGFNLFSPQQDVEIGQQSAAQAEQQLPLVRDREVNDYVNRIGQRLVAASNGPKFPYTFKVVNATDINAFALPGGPIYINRGTIENAKNEGELAGVIAHEIAHVELRHGTHQASKAQAAQAGISILGGILGGKVGQSTAGIINAVGGFGLNALFLKFSRELETQADVRGAQLLAASGYTPNDMVSFFQTLSKVDTSRKTSFLSDHPAPPDRIARIQKESQLLRVNAQPTTNVAELQRVQGDLRGLGSAPKAGSTQTAQANTRTRPSSSGQTASVGAVPAPSTSMRSYTSPTRVYRISYPSNWQVYDNGGTGGVTIAPQNGVATLGNDRNEIIYGAIINHYEPFGNSPNRRYLNNGGTYGTQVTLDNATADLVAQMRSTSPHLKPVSGSTQRFNLSGGAAIATALRGRNPNTNLDERITVVARQLHDQHLLYMLFVTPEQEARNYGPVLQAMVNSLQVAEDAH